MRPFILAVLTFASPIFGSEESSKKLPAAVVAYDAEQGFKLSDTAMKRMGIQFVKLKGNGPWEIPQSALVKVKRSIGVYREAAGFLTFVLIELVNGKIQSTDLREGDGVAIEGSNFLRVIDLDLSGGSGDSC